MKFSIEEIRQYLEGCCLNGDDEKNDMLKYAISELEDYEDGIEAVTERIKSRRTGNEREKI